MNSEPNAARGARRERVDAGRSAAGQPGADDGRGLTDIAGELLAYALYYAETKLDSACLSARGALVRLALLALVWLTGAAAVLTLTIVSATFFVRGLAGGLGGLVEDRPWVGELVAGAFLLGCVGAVVYVYLSSLQKASLERTIKKHELRQAQQQSRFGRSVADEPTSSAEDRG
jgi:hypothetical protein